MERIALSDAEIKQGARALASGRPWVYDEWLEAMRAKYGATDFDDRSTLLLHARFRSMVPPNPSS